MSENPPKRSLAERRNWIGHFFSISLRGNGSWGIYILPKSFKSWESSQILKLFILTTIRERISLQEMQKGFSLGAIASPCILLTPFMPHDGKSCNTAFDLLKGKKADATEKTHYSCASSCSSMLSTLQTESLVECNSVIQSRDLANVPVCKNIA